MEQQKIRQIWEKDIKGRVFRKASSNVNPVTIFLGGQPGAGKTQGKNFALAQYEEGAVAEIIGDDFRQYHPDYQWLVETDPLRMPDVTAPASGAWIGMCVEYAEANNISFLVEGTWRNPVTVLDTALRARQLGRKTHAVVLAVPPALSLAGAVERFYRDMLRGIPARWTPPTAHDQTVSHLIENVTEIASASYQGKHLMNRFTVTDRAGEILYDGSPSSEAVRVFQANFERPLTPAEREIVQDSLTLAEQGHEQFTATNQSAAQVLDRLHASL